MRLFTIVPGYITSKNDGQQHFIGAVELMKLYGLKQEDCWTHLPQYKCSGLCYGTIHLKPLFSGEYFNVYKDGLPDWVVV